jgi:hypothetical protein
MFRLGRSALMLVIVGAFAGSSGEAHAVPLSAGVPGGSAAALMVLSGSTLPAPWVTVGLLTAPPAPR